MPDEPQEHARKKRKQTTAWTGYIQALVRGNTDTSSPRVPSVPLPRAPKDSTQLQHREAPDTVRSRNESGRKAAGNRREVRNSQTSQNHPRRTTACEPQASTSTTSAIPSSSTQPRRVVEQPPKPLPRESRLGPSFIDSSRAHDDSPSSSLPKPRVGSRLLPATLPRETLSTPGNDIPSASRGPTKPVAPPPLCRQSSDAPLNASVETASLARDQSTKEVAEISNLEESRKVEADHREPPDEPIEPDPGPEELFLSSDSDSRHSAELIEQILLSSPRSGKGQLLVPKEEIDEEKPDVGRGSPLKKGKKVVWLSSEGEEDAIMMGEERGEATEKAFEDDLIVSASSDKLALNLGTSSRASNPVDTVSRANEAVTSLSQQQELPTRSPRKSNLARKSAPSPRSTRPPIVHRCARKSASGPSRNPVVAEAAAASVTTPRSEAGPQDIADVVRSSPAPVPKETTRASPPTSVVNPPRRHTNIARKSVDVPRRPRFPANAARKSASTLRAVASSDSESDSESDAIVLAPKEVSASTTQVSSKVDSHPLSRPFPSSATKRTSFKPIPSIAFNPPEPHRSTTFSWVPPLRKPNHPVSVGASSSTQKNLARTGSSSSSSTTQASTTQAPTTQVSPSREKETSKASGSGRESAEKGGISSDQETEPSAPRTILTRLTRGRSSASSEQLLAGIDEGELSTSSKSERVGSSERMLRKRSSDGTVKAEKARQASATLATLVSTRMERGSSKNNRLQEQVDNVKEKPWAEIVKVDQGPEVNVPQDWKAPPQPWMVRDPEDSINEAIHGKQLLLKLEKLVVDTDSFATDDSQRGTLALRLESRNTIHGFPPLLTLASRKTPFPFAIDHPFDTNLEADAITLVPDPTCAPISKPLILPFDPKLCRKAGADKITLHVSIEIGSKHFKARYELCSTNSPSDALIPRSGTPFLRFDDREEASTGLAVTIDVVPLRKRITSGEEARLELERRFARMSLDREGVWIPDAQSIRQEGHEIKEYRMVDLRQDGRYGMDFVTKLPYRTGEIVRDYYHDTPENTAHWVRTKDDEIFRTTASPQEKLLARAHMRWGLLNPHPPTVFDREIACWIHNAPLVHHFSLRFELAKLLLFRHLKHRLLTESEVRKILTRYDLEKEKIEKGERKTYGESRREALWKRENPD